MSPQDCSQQFGNPRTYYPKLAKVTGGVVAAIFLGYLQQQAEEAGSWIAKEVREIERETGLSAKEQEWARKQLRDRGLIEERLTASSPSMLEFGPRWEVLQEKLAVFGRLLGEESSLSGEGTPVVTAPLMEESARSWGRDRNVLPNYRFEGPWQSREQLEAFQRALLDYAIAQGWEYPSGWAFKIIDGLTKGLISPYWDEFLKGVPFGSTQQVQRDWEVEPGVPYPAFEEERVQYYIHKGEPLDAAVARSRAELRNPKIAGDLWEGFLRRCDRWADEAIKAQKLGVKVPYLPPSFTEKNAITSESVAQKLATLTSQPELPAAPSVPLTSAETDIPSLATLQTLYKSPLSRAIAQRQIAEHPEWGYTIIDGSVVDLYPF
ncbi:hypothetical protein [Oscillatoria sp. FACHB-1406]|uniref:hypothetical protein n=1 Tax=Oscillatoria sp. FACHB-1406 TaxID=2692846 RepID=UPI0016820F50|nr:hypothetical protein [Oscillatoria sp. FACHB-1406]MBD2578584.1 hypothetical protein [Oscillatoria sp. FACHB-1406]